MPKKKIVIKKKKKKAIIKKKNEKLNDIEALKKRYIESMDEKEQIAYKIAKEHLDTSFNLEKSIGFQKWLKKNSNNI